MNDHAQPLARIPFVWCPTRGQLFMLSSCGKHGVAPLSSTRLSAHRLRLRRETPQEEAERYTLESR